MSPASSFDPENPFTGELNPGGRPALLLIDLVRAYFEPEGPFYLHTDEALQGSRRLLGQAREARIPIIHTRVAYTDGGADGGVFLRKVPQLSIFAGDSPMGELMPEVAPKPGEPVLIKQYASAFFGTSLASTLHTLNVDTVLIGGVSTSGCVRASAVDALQHGFIPVVVRDAVGDRGERQHEASLFDIEQKYGEVIGAHQAQEYLAKLPRTHGTRSEDAQ